MTLEIQYKRIHQVTLHPTQASNLTADVQIQYFFYQVQKTWSKDDNVLIITYFKHINVTHHRSQFERYTRKPPLKSNLRIVGYTIYDNIAQCCISNHAKPYIYISY